MGNFLNAPLVDQGVKTNAPRIWHLLAGIAAVGVSYKTIMFLVWLVRRLRNGSHGARLRADRDAKST